MLALTVHQPWAWAIAHSTKRVENREWEPPSHLIGKYLAIHAASRPRTKKGMREVEAVATELGAPRDLVFGAVVAIVKVTGVVREEPPATDPHYEWFVGPLGWTLDDVVALERPIFMRGHQKLWTLPTPAVADARLQWKAGKGHTLTYAEQERLALRDWRTH